jgi:hypothetical protein
MVIITNYLLVRPVSARRIADIVFRIMHSRFLLLSSQYVSEPHNPKPPNGNPQSYLMEVMICKLRCDAVVSCELWTDVPLVVLNNSRLINIESFLKQLSGNNAIGSSCYPLSLRLFACVRSQNSLQSCIRCTLSHAFTFRLQNS